MAILLSEVTIKLLNGSECDLREISNSTGLYYDWLVKLKASKIKDPSVNKIQRLYEHLSGKPLITESN